jgi:hypothetical protein
VTLRASSGNRRRASARLNDRPDAPVEALDRDAPELITLQ